MPTRAVGYVRVSTAREEMIAPEIQEAAIREHCTRHGYELVDIIADLDRTGRNFAREGVQRVIGMVEAREATVAVVWKWPRFGRSRRDWHVQADRIEVVGGRLESATEPVEASSVGKFTRGMLVELAAFESDRIGDVWREVLDKRLRDGLPHNGRPRFGYVYDRTNGYTPHEVTGPTLAKMYAEYTAGSSDYAIAADLNRRGITTTSGGTWETTRVRRLLEAGFGAGLLYLEHRPPKGQRRERDPEWVPGSHPAVITADEWDAYRRARSGRQRSRPWARRSTYLLSGLIKCGTCGGAMTGGLFGKNPVAMYRCDRWRGTGGQVCTANYVRCELVDRAVFEWLVGECAVDIDAAPVPEQVDARAQHEADAARHAAEATRLETALVRLSQQHAEDPESDEVTFRRARDDYRARIRAAHAAHDAAMQALDLLASPAAHVFAPIVEAWDTMSVEGRRDGLTALLARVLVWSTGRGQPPRVEPVPRWADAG